MTISLDILSDPICPWCYIGKARLDEALAARPDHPLDIVWRPFQLNPEMPREGMGRRPYLERKFGGPEGADRVYDAIAAAADADGLPIHFDAITRTPNTLDAHRLIRWAYPAGRQTAVVDALFDRYFLQGEDIGDRAVLIDVAEASGLDVSVVVDLLAGEEDLDAVRREDETARKAGVTGVPTFVVAGRHVVPGAQNSDLWIRVIDELIETVAEAKSAAGLNGGFAEPDA